LSIKHFHAVWTGNAHECSLKSCIGKASAAVLGINPGTLDDPQHSQAQLGLTFPLLHDPGAQVAALYGARQEDGTVRRTVYLIDTQGMIRYGRPGMHWNEAFLSALSALA
jgi:peroxiredoxin